MQYHPEMLSRFIAHKIDDFTSAEIPELEGKFDQQNHWLINHFLNSAFRARFRGKIRILVYNQIRRAQQCLLEFNRARRLTLEFLDKTRSGYPASRSYFEALGAWEASLMNYAIAVEIFNKINNKKLFQQGRGTTYEQAYYLNNVLKHYAADLENWADYDDPVEAVLPVDGEPPNLPIWLSNDGLNAIGGSLGFGDYAEIVAELAALADQLSDPLKWSQEVRKELEQPYAIG
jgi:hypothetical protein